MKANEIQPKNEHIIKEAGDEVEGSYGSSLFQRVRNMFGRGNDNANMSTVDIQARKDYTKDFISTASSALNSAIQGGKVDPNLRSDAETPAEPAPEAPELQGQALNLDDYKKRREAERAAAIQAQRDVQAQIKQTAASNAATSAADNELVARVRAEKQKPGFQQDKGLIRRAASRGIHETKYQQLNAIFENIMLNEAGVQSISEFLSKWIVTYTRDPNINTSVIKARIKDVENSYGRDKGKAALTKLALAAYAEDLQGGADPEEEEGTPAVRPTSTTAPTRSEPAKSYDIPNNAPDIVNSVRSSLIKLQRLDDAAYKKLIQDINNAATTPSE